MTWQIKVGTLVLAVLFLGATVWGAVGAVVGGPGAPRPELSLPERTRVPTSPNVTVEFNVTSVKPYPTETPVTPPPLRPAVPLGTPRIIEYRTINVPEFSTWGELRGYIAQLHGRLRAFAATSPDERFGARVSPARLLTKEEIDILSAKYNVRIGHANFRVGTVSGAMALRPESDLPNNIWTLAGQEQIFRDRGLIGPNDHMMVEHFSAEGRVEDLVRMADEPAIALVFADHVIDIKEGLIPENVLFRNIPTIFVDYQRLAPADAIPTGPIVPGPLSPPASIQ